MTDTAELIAEARQQREWLIGAQMPGKSAEKLIDMLDRLATALEGATRALEECVEVLELVEHPRFEDPDYGDVVRALGERIGFGALMSSASASWRKSAQAKGYPVGGEFVAGPCQSTVTKALVQARAALTTQPEGQPHE